MVSTVHNFWVTMHNPAQPSKPAKKPMRTEMPTIAEWVDAMVAAFGKEEVHGQIRRGMAGEPCFFASENGHVIGTPPVRGRYLVRWDIRDDAHVESIDAGIPASAGG